MNAWDNHKTLYNLAMSLTVRLILGFLVVLAAFWILSLVAGWLWYVVVVVSVVAVIALVVWAVSQQKKKTTAISPQALTKKQEKLAEKELAQLEKRQKNGQ
jgi:membrane protein implicated in regulation of membrane protease activity